MYYINWLSNFEYLGTFDVNNTWLWYITFIYIIIVFDFPIFIEDF